MTEDDTFNKLKRAPFRVIREAWNTYRGVGNDVLPEERMKELGWTRIEYIEEHYRRWRNNEL